MTVKKAALSNLVVIALFMFPGEVMAQRSDGASYIEQRINQLQQSVTELAQRIEQLRRQDQQLQQKLEQMRSSYEQRLERLEKGNAAKPPAARSKRRR